MPTVSVQTQSGPRRKQPRRRRTRRQNVNRTQPIQIKVQAAGQPNPRRPANRRPRRRRRQRRTNNRRNRSGPTRNGSTVHKYTLHNHWTGVYDSDDFAFEIFRLGDLGIPHADRIAKSYETFSIRNIQIWYVAAQGTAQSGQITWGIDFSPNDTNRTKEQIRDLQPSGQSATYRGFDYRFTQADMRKVTKAKDAILYTSANGVSNASPLFALYYSAEGSSAVLGTWWVHADISYSTPCTPRGGGADTNREKVVTQVNVAGDSQVDPPKVAMLDVETEVPTLSPIEPTTIKQEDTSTLHSSGAEIASTVPVGSDFTAVAVAPKTFWYSTSPPTITIRDLATGRPIPSDVISVKPLTADSRVYGRNYDGFDLFGVIGSILQPLSGVAEVLVNSVLPGILLYDGTDPPVIPLTTVVSLGNQVEIEAPAAPTYNLGSFNRAAFSTTSSNNDSQTATWTNDMMTDVTSNGTRQITYSAVKPDWCGTMASTLYNKEYPTLRLPPDATTESYYTIIPFIHNERETMAQLAGADFMVPDLSIKPLTWTTPRVKAGDHIIVNERASFVAPMVDNGGSAYPRIFDLSIRETSRNGSQPRVLPPGDSSTFAPPMLWHAIDSSYNYHECSQAFHGSEPGARELHGRYYDDAYTDITIPCEDCIAILINNESRNVINPVESGLVAPTFTQTQGNRSCETWTVYTYTAVLRPTDVEGLEVAETNPPGVYTMQAVPRKNTVRSALYTRPATRPPPTRRMPLPDVDPPIYFSDDSDESSDYDSPPPSPPTARRPLLRGDRRSN